MPSYAVITICRNAATTVGRAIHSVFAQNPPPARYVFVDGESEDNTLDTIQQTLRSVDTGATDCRILNQTLEPGRAGIPAAWNQGLAETEEDLIFILNADDWYEADAARCVLEACAARPEADIFVSPIQIRTAVDAPVQAVRQPRNLRLLPLLMPLPHPGCFVKRQVYTAIGSFDERYAVSADYDFIYRAVRAGAAFHWLPNPLVNMQPGGFARRQVQQARRETRAIARRQGGGRLLPWAAFAIRTLLRR